MNLGTGMRAKNMIAIDITQVNTISIGFAKTTKTNLSKQSKTLEASFLT
jgi:hypothetical protein